MTQPLQQPARPPDPEFERDLHPQPGAGVHHGMDGSRPELGAPSAYDLKAVHRHLHQLADSDLKQLPILPPGSRLEQGAT